MLMADLSNLKHMVAAHEKRVYQGFRNHFAPGGEDVASMLRLEAQGLVIRGRPYQETFYFHATAAGCKAAGLGPTATKRALRTS